MAEKDHFWSEKEMSRRDNLFEYFKSCPIPDEEIMKNLGLFISKTEFARTLYMWELYQKILNVHGVIMEFGVRWGQNLALYETFRGILEPFNCNRRIIGFDTFEGLKNVSSKDGSSDYAKEGHYAVGLQYQEYLESLLRLHEQEGPTGHVEKIQLIQGDASETIKSYLADHPETIIALAYFDFDIYEPTKNCLEAIKGHLTKGSVLAFDELNCDIFPGETVALKEVLGLDQYRIVHTPLSSNRAYLIVE